MSNLLLSELGAEVIRFTFIDLRASYLFYPIVFRTMSMRSCKHTCASSLTLVTS